MPSNDATTINELSSLLPQGQISATKIEILSTPTGTPDYINAHVDTKFRSCSETLSLLQEVPDARIKFHLHRMCASACRVQHLFRLIPPRFSMPFAKAFEETQHQYYSKMNDVPLSTSATTQTSLPFRLGVHGFIAMHPLVNASYASSIITSAPHRLQVQDDSHLTHYRRSARPYLRTLMRDLPPTDRLPAYSMSRSASEDYPLGQYEPTALANRPEKNSPFFISGHTCCSFAAFLGTRFLDSIAKHSWPLYHVGT